MEEIVESVAFSPDGKVLAATSGSHIRLWNVGTGREIRVLRGHWNGVLSIAFSPDGSTLASGAADSSIRLWNLATGQEIRSFSTDPHYANSVAYSPDGKSLVAASGGNRIQLYLVMKEGELFLDFQGHKKLVSSVAFSPDGRTMASGSETVKLWDVATRRIIRTHSRPSSAVAFRGDGKMLASASAASENHNIMAWDVESGKLIWTAQGHTTRVRSLAFSPNGTLLAAAAIPIFLFNVGTGRKVETLGGRSVFVCVAFSPDGKILAGGTCNTVNLWCVEEE